jgi:hypothetical protein
LWPAFFSFQSAAIPENGKCGRRFLDFSRPQSPKMTNAADFGCLIAGHNPQKTANVADGAAPRRGCFAQIEFGTAMW